jgi:formamidopyrimidine-DNA glycosylase
MVEGPQATHLTKWIRKRFLNQTLNQIKIASGRYKKHGPPKNFHVFSRQLPLKLKDVVKKGKVIFFLFDNLWAIIVRLGMTGWFDEKEENPNIILEFSKSNLYFKDLRQFGTFTITNNPDVVVKEWNKLAPDVLDSSISFGEFKENLKHIGTKTLDVILMDQKKIFSGIGNIIKSEILYDSKISPKRRGNELNEEEWRRIYDSSRKISKKILENIENNKGDFQNVIRVYEKDKDPNGNEIDVYESKDGRVTYWSPNVQT